MNRYVVFMSGGQEIVERTYPGSFRLKGCDAWAIGSDDSTCANVCERLGIGGDEPKSRCRVPDRAVLRSL